MKSNTDQTTRRQHLQRVGGVTLTAIGGTTFATNSASANETDRPNGILADGVGVEGGDNWAFAQGLMASISVSRSANAETLADQIRNEFRANTDLWIAYGNWLIDEYDDVRPAGSVAVQVDVVKTNWIADDERVETVIEATFDDDAYEYTDLTWEIGAPEEPDYTVEIRNKAAEDAADELLEYRQEFIDEEGDNHDLPDEAYVSKLAGKYAPSVAFGEEGHNVLELLVGDLKGTDA